MLCHQCVSYYGDKVIWDRLISTMGFPTLVQLHIAGLVQERRNCIANALELRLSCMNPVIFTSKWPTGSGVLEVPSPLTLPPKNPPPTTYKQYTSYDYDNLHIQFMVKHKPDLVHDLTHWGLKIAQNHLSIYPWVACKYVTIIIWTWLLMTWLLASPGHQQAMILTVLD